MAFYGPIAIVVALLAFSAGVLVYGVLVLLAPSHGALHERLRGEQNNEANPSASGMLLERLTTIMAPVSKIAYGANKKYIAETKQLLVNAGQVATDDIVWQLLAKQLAVGVLFGGGAVLAGLFYIQAAHIKGNDALLMPVGALAGGMLLGRHWPTMKLKKIAKERQESIQRTLPDVLDLLVICVEAGLGFDAAILRVSREVEPVAPAMAFELQRTHSELSAGIPRASAFKNLGARSTVTDLSSLCTLIIQSDKLGTSIADSLRVYADEMRVKRRQRAEELAQKASIKMLFPLVFFVFPSLFLIILGPAIISIWGTLQEMGK